VYCNKQNVNQLTALLVAHGIRHAIVCPGSRNAPIVHNFNECPAINCYPVSDERSAGFYALGMMQALHQPVVVCVTSGTALLNLAPAVAEAYYQHQPLIVVSADRPAAWIGQLDGQTLPQPGALGCFVRCSVSLPEDDLWHINRLINEALLSATSEDKRPVHINVPITEPLFTFDVPELPLVRQIIRPALTRNYDCLHTEFVDGLFSAERPMIVFGQTNPHDFECNGLDYLFSHVIVLHESLSKFPYISHFDEVLYAYDMAAPDFIIYVGDVIVSKRLRHFLRDAHDAQTWRISSSVDVEDTFQNLRGIIVGDPKAVLLALSQKLSLRQWAAMDYHHKWMNALTRASRIAADFQPAYSQMAVVKTFEQKLSALQTSTLFHVHYANSSAARLANIYACHHVWCNRGVNGIEGSLSTASGFSVVTAEHVCCVIGDLSFFYDQNALWNQNLRGNLRILLLNNGCGGIFNMLPGLEQSPARDRLVAAAHDTTAEGICRQNAITYMKADTMEQLFSAIDTLLNIESPRPVLLEVFTNAAEDERVYKAYYQEQKEG